MIKELNSIQDDKELYDRLDEITKTEKEDFEDAIIGYTLRPNLSDDIVSFLNKYMSYIKEKSKNNVMEYLNNNYLNYIYHIELEKELYGNKDETKFYLESMETQYKDDSIINSSTVSNICDDVTAAYKNTISKLERNEELSTEEQEFVKNFFLSIAFLTYIDNNPQKRNLMKDIDLFFNKYPITIADTSSLKNKQLYIIKCLVNELNKFNIGIRLSFNRYYNNDNIRTDGYFAPVSSGEYLIHLDNMGLLNLGEEADLATTLHTTFHEIGHLHQQIYIDQYSSDIQKKFKMEAYIREKDNRFYMTYHDNFYSEIYANKYAYNIFKESSEPEYKKYLNELEQEIIEKEEENKTKYIIIENKYNELIKEDTTNEK